MQLRNYQLDTLAAIKHKLSTGINRQLVKLPTGTGKTEIIAAKPTYMGFNKRSMFIVHREELAEQSVRKLKLRNPDKSVSLEMADSYDDGADLVVASVQTLGMKGSKRIQRFDPNDFDSIDFDEAHHCTGETYANIINHFKLVGDVGRLCNGVTATPNRADGKGLSHVFQEIVYDYSLLQAIKDGWLVDLKGIRVSTDNSLDGVKTLGGDFNLGDLGDAINTPQRNDLIARAWLEHGQDRITVAFTVDIKHAQDLALAFKNYGIAAEAVWGNDPDRQEKVKALRAGQLKVVTNCNLLTEGFDMWEIGCIVLARPTKSETLYTQIVGRGTRIPEGIENLVSARSSGLSLLKEDCLLLDVVDLTSKHSLVSLPTLFGLPAKLDLKGKKITSVLQEIEDLTKAKPHIDISKAEDATKLKAYAEQVDLFRIQFMPEVIQHSEFQWFKTGQDRYTLTLPGSDSIVISRDLLDLWHVDGTILTTPIHTKHNDFSSAIKHADSMVRIYGGNSALALVQREAKWHNTPPTPAQLMLCNKFRIPVPPTATKGEVSKKLSKHLLDLKTKREARMRVA